MTAKQPARLVIVDDHTLMRSGLEAMLKSEADFEVVGVEADGPSAVRAAADLAPDIMLIDVNMRSVSGIDAIREIKRRYPQIRIVALTFQQDDKCIRATLKAGADAYVLKDDSRTALLSALSALTRDQNYLSPAICSKVIAGYLSGSGADGVSQERWEVLTKREREVLRLIAEGRRTKEIADFLSLSPKTVEKHRSNMMRKLDLHSVSEVTVYAIENGFYTH